MRFFSPISYKLQDLHFSSLSSFHVILILFHRPDDNLGCKGFHNRPKYLSLFNCPSPCPFSLLSLPLPPTNQLQAGTNNSKHFLYLKNKIRQILYCWITMMLFLGGEQQVITFMTNLDIQQVLPVNPGADFTKGLKLSPYIG